jgi:hypothetical protein
MKERDEVFAQNGYCKFNQKCPDYLLISLRDYIKTTLFQFKLSAEKWAYPSDKTHFSIVWQDA